MTSWYASINDGPRRRIRPPQCAEIEARRMSPESHSGCIVVCVLDANTLRAAATKECS